MDIKSKSIAALSVGLFLAGTLVAQDCPSDKGFNNWLQCRIDTRKSAAANQVNPDNVGDKFTTATHGPVILNATNGTRQEDAAAVSSNSNSLVDQSSASDLVNLALNLSKLSPSTSSGDNANSVTVTTSAYALYAAANRHDVLDPAFYNRNRQWRRFYLTLGQDVADTTSSNTSATADPHANRSGTIVGLKVLLWSHRDITDPSNAQMVHAAFDDALTAAGHAGRAVAVINNSLHSVFPDIESRFASLSSSESQQVDQIIDRSVGPIQELDQVTSAAYDKLTSELKGRPQLSLAYSAEVRDDQGYNQHSVRAVLDWGLHPRVNWTANAGFDLYDAKDFGRNRNGGSASTELQLRVTEDIKEVQPVLFSLSGYGQWLSNVNPTYKIQGKLTIPLGQKTGVSLPISVTYASRTDLIQEAHTEAKFGFTFDAAKIAAALLPPGFKH
jgi:hypothetical protein